MKGAHLLLFRALCKLEGLEALDFMHHTEKEIQYITSDTREVVFVFYPYGNLVKNVGELVAYSLSLVRKGIIDGMANMKGGLGIEFVDDVKKIMKDIMEKEHGIEISKISFF